ncbi:hypothetical protein [Paraliomyxa miuraensis]|uniref:hypothetical protein n=1 Tax=Paraliomyxa miuraensis TaxID=376150 RepID=UPI00225155E2|nr:hypothetical protein [Paraliomyxa miuraensis]MCX4246868.1 hypothetical protein [Paraliomyxa miuraensis]
MISAVLGLLLSPAPVYVERVSSADPTETRSLRDQLMMRLLEEGYPLAPSADQATRTLRVEPTPGGIRVEAEGEDTLAFEVATGPVLPLEAVHRAIEALEEVTPRPTPQGTLPSRVAVRVDAPPAAISPDALRRTLVEQLLERHRTVVPLDAEPDQVLCAEGRGEALALSRADEADGCGLASDLQAKLVGLEPVESGREPDPLALDSSLDALLSPDEPAPRRTTSSERPASTMAPSASLTDDRTLEPPRRGPAVRIGARTGVYGRMTAADAAVGTTLRVGGEPGPAGLFDVLMVPSSAPDISIFETSISGGFGWMFEVSPVVALHAQALGGVLVHRYRQRGARTGHRVDWTAELPLGASFRLPRGLRIELTLRAGRSARDREHRVDDVAVWSRTAWRIGASVGLSYGWRPR